MSRRRSRSRRRGGSTARIAVAVLLVLGLIGGPGPIGLLAFQTGEVERTTSLATVDDGNAGMYMDPHRVMNSGETCTLVDLTNDLGTGLDVTVSLRDDSTQHGNLTLESTGDEGNEVTFSLASGASETVGISLVSDIADGTNVYFHVNATSAPIGLTATDRYGTVDDSQVTTRCDITV